MGLNAGRVEIRHSTSWKVPEFKIIRKPILNFFVNIDKQIRRHAEVPPVLKKCLVGFTLFVINSLIHYACFDHIQQRCKK